MRTTLLSKKQLKVWTDTFTNKIMNYPTGRAFCDEFEIKGYNLSKYILEGYKYKGRYKIENVF